VFCSFFNEVTSCIVALTNTLSNQIFTKDLWFFTDLPAFTIDHRKPELLDKSLTAIAQDMQTLKKLLE